MKLSGPAGALYRGGQPVATLGAWAAESDGDDWEIVAPVLFVADPFLWEHSARFELALRAGSRIARWQVVEVAMEEEIDDSFILRRPAAWPFIAPPQKPRTPATITARGKPKEAKCPTVSSSLIPSPSP